MNVLILDDHPFCAATTARVVLTALPNARVTKTASLRKGIEALRSENFGLVVADLTLSDSEPHQTFEAISSFVERSKVIFLSGLAEEFVVVSQIEREGFKFVSKTTEPIDFARLIGRMFPFGGRFSEPSNEFQSSIAFGNNKPLTLKQVAVMDLLVEGKTVKDIARELGRSPDTVKSHVRDIFQRLGASSREQAIINYMIAREANQPVFDL